LGSGKRGKKTQFRINWRVRKYKSEKKRWGKKKKKGDKVFGIIMWEKGERILVNPESEGGGEKDIGGGGNVSTAVSTAKKKQKPYITKGRIRKKERMAKYP